MFVRYLLMYKIIFEKKQFLNKSQVFCFQV